jgi:hypothetical protein
MPYNILTFFGIKKKITNYKTNYQLENILDRIWNAFKLNKATAPTKNTAPLKTKGIKYKYCGELNKDICINKICLNERFANELSSS